ncbi:acyltransferase family protein [Bacillus sp. ISL-40]|uniref:acyltransferase family protein n=1 Tax=unclassified Bacillus (in: firmicutes) TaxID=185979 RepID=UPI001BE7274C|nr:MULTISPECIES: acyltransferase family protein [unclassified Bacillus (in: firmicutes)]MBT2696336.1 acyltransferase family protein [Bacillus sp. ISL-40]MBT2743185.1 acyltransferase family protein [Bacillus sp. ISL-77]
MSKKRETWIDIAKGLGIILVVIGHSGNEFAHHYFFWFHMPLFFILSGHTFKTLKNKSELLKWIKKRIIQLIVPYMSFGLVILIGLNLKNIVTAKFSILDFMKGIFRLAYGGQILSGAFAVFWFITCLLVTQVLFALVTYFFKSTKTQLFIIGIFYILAHLEIKLLPKLHLPVPWNIDVFLIAIVYFAIGFYLNKNFNIKILFKAHNGILVNMFSIVLILADYNGFYYYSLDMKYHQYTHIILDLLIPTVMTMSICIISFWLSKVPKTKFLANLGITSLPIMYLHFPINIELEKIIGNYGWFLFLIIGVSIPVLVNVLFLERFTITKALFLGDFSKTMLTKTKVKISA